MKLLSYLMKSTSFSFKIKILFKIGKAWHFLKSVKGDVKIHPTGCSKMAAASKGET